MNNSDKPINATLTYNSSTGLPNGQYLGLTKREYFAGLAMQGLIISQGEKNMVNDWGVHGQRISENATNIADELLKQLEINK